MPIRRRRFLGSLPLLPWLPVPTGVAAPHARDRRPDIVLLVADDLAFGDLSCHGRLGGLTPRIDALARESLRLDAAYSASPWCTPSRCALLTGQYPQRHPVGRGGPLPARAVADPGLGLAPSVPTLASMLRDAGYRTALVGKWHLGYPPRFGPAASGFDTFFGVLGGVVDPVTHLDLADSRDLYDGDEPADSSGYLADLFTSRACELLESGSAAPLFLCVAFTAPHWPWVVPGVDEQDTFRSYERMLNMLDGSVGTVLETLGHARRNRRSLVVFTSDNGGDSPARLSPFTGGKGTLREGGIRVPAFVRCPDDTGRASRIGLPVHAIDLAATILEAAGIGVSPARIADGVPLRRLLDSPEYALSRPLFWQSGDDCAARLGRWKFLREAGRDRLFDLDADPQEATDLADSNRQVLHRLRAMHAQWSADPAFADPG